MTSEKFKFGDIVWWYKVSKAGMVFGGYPLKAVVVDTETIQESIGIITERHKEIKFIYKFDYELRKKKISNKKYEKEYQEGFD